MKNKERVKKIRHPKRINSHTYTNNYDSWDCAQLLQWEKSAAKHRSEINMLFLKIEPNANEILCRFLTYMPLPSSHMMHMIFFYCCSCCCCCGSNGHNFIQSNFSTHSFSLSYTAPNENLNWFQVDDNRSSIFDNLLKITYRNELSANPRK